MVELGSWVWSRKHTVACFPPTPLAFPPFLTLLNTRIYTEKKKKNFGIWIFLLFKESPDLEEEKEINCIKIQDCQGALVFLDVGPKGCSSRNCLGLLASSSPSRDNRCLSVDGDS